MNVIIGVTVLLIIVVSLVLAFSSEFKQDTNKVSAAVTILVLSALCGYVVSIASG